MRQKNRIRLDLFVQRRLCKVFHQFFQVNVYRTWFLVMKVISNSISQ